MDQFLQSESWAHFREVYGQKSVKLGDGAYGFVHTLPMVGTYLYIPRWPNKQNQAVGELQKNQEALIRTGRDLGVGWIRIDPETDAIAADWQSSLREQLVKAPHDMQPRENLVIDISKPEENILAQMKSKTRYNIRLAEKKGVSIFATREKRYQETFFSLIEATAKRQGILPHERSYYEKYLSVFPEDELTLFIAEYKGKSLAANLVLFYGDTATYLHGGTSDEYREVMAPVLLQWEQIREAKRHGCAWYDFGGIKTISQRDGSGHASADSWAGITRFKKGFSPETIPMVSPGSYDIILDTKKYWLYDRLRHLQEGLALFRKFLRSH